MRDTARFIEAIEDRHDEELILEAARARGGNRDRSRDRSDWRRQLLTDYTDATPESRASRPANGPPDLPA